MSPKMNLNMLPTVSKSVVICRRSSVFRVFARNPIGTIVPPGGATLNSVLMSPFGQTKFLQYEENLT